MSFEVLGWPADGPKLRLDHERFAYAGKFVMSSTGKAVWRDPAATASPPERPPGEAWADAEGVVAAVAFNEDRTDPDRLWLRYVTVRADRRGEGIGPRLVRAVVDRAQARGYERVAIGVNNPYAYEALSRAGFAFTGETTGVAELVMEWPGDDDPARYHAGLTRFAERDHLDDEMRAFVAEKRERGPPDGSA